MNIAVIFVMRKLLELEWYLDRNPIVGGSLIEVGKSVKISYQKNFFQ